MRYRITTIVKGNNYYEVEADNSESAEEQVYAYLEGETSSARCVGDRFDVEYVNSIEEVK